MCFQDNAKILKISSFIQSGNLFFELEPHAYLKLMRTLFHREDFIVFSLHFVVVASRFSLLLSLRSLSRALCFADINLIECLLLNNKKVNGVWSLEFTKTEDFLQRVWNSR